MNNLNNILSELLKPILLVVEMRISNKNTETLPMTEAKLERLGLKFNDAASADELRLGLVEP